jgi:cell division protein ZapE
MNKVTNKKIITLDIAQQKLSELLNTLQAQLNSNIPSKIAGFFRKKNNINIKGIYIYGPVGSGKSTLMEEFFQKLNTKRKLLIHFHEFMQNIHTEVFHIRARKVSSPIKIIARKLAKDFKIICLDELEINDIADAMIIGKLFQQLLENEVIIVITSNKHPDDLYTEGLQRAKFLEFIALIKNELTLFYLDNEIDYRLNKINSNQQIFFIPNNLTSQKQIDKLFKTLSANNLPYPHIIELKGRTLVCKISYKNIVKFTFNELCKENLGPADYIAICKNFRVIILTDIPKLSWEHSNEVVRFINLIDEIYKHNILLILSCETPLNQVYTQGKLIDKFQRTLSRLIEMQSEEYINKAKKFVL